MTSSVGTKIAEPIYFLKIKATVIGTILIPTV